MTDFDEDELVVSSTVSLSDIAYNLEAKGIEVVKEFITTLDGMASDCDFTQALYEHVCSIWNEMNEGLIAAGETPAPGYQPKPVNITLNVNADPEFTKEVIRAMRAQERKR